MTLFHAAGNWYWRTRKREKFANGEVYFPCLVQITVLGDDKEMCD